MVMRGGDRGARGAKKIPHAQKIVGTVYTLKFMDCYHFCQQCGGHFETAGSTGLNRTSYVASFLCGPITYRWTQYKRRHQSEGASPITWVEFKAFLRKNLGDSRSFVDNIWSKIKLESQYQLEEARDWVSHLEHLQSIGARY